MNRIKKALGFAVAASAVGALMAAGQPAAPAQAYDWGNEASYLSCVEAQNNGGRTLDGNLYQVPGDAANPYEFIGDITWGGSFTDYGQDVVVTNANDVSFGVQPNPQLGNIWDADDGSGNGVFYLDQNGLDLGYGYTLGVTDDNANFQPNGYIVAQMPNPTDDVQFLFMIARSNTPGSPVAVEFNTYDIRDTQETFFSASDGSTGFTALPYTTSGGGWAFADPSDSTLDLSLRVTSSTEPQYDGTNFPVIEFVGLATLDCPPFAAAPDPLPVSIFSPVVTLTALAAAGVGAGAFAFIRRRRPAPEGQR